MPQMPYRPIYEDDDLIVFVKSAASDVTIFAFNNWGTIYPTPEVWGTHFIDRSGFNAVVFMAKARNWFPAHSVSRAIAALAQHVAPSAFSFTFGASMGGYAAIKYQKLLGADACLSFSPQYSIDPVTCPFDRRFSSCWTPAMEGMEIGPDEIGPHAFVVHDPKHPEDAAHARIISGLADVHLVSVFHTDHFALRTAVQGGTISEMISIIRSSSGRDAQQIQSLFRSRKKRSYDYYHHLAKYLIARKRGRMLSLLVAFMERHSGLREANQDSIRELVAGASIAPADAAAPPPDTPPPGHRTSRAAPDATPETCGGPPSLGAPARPSGPAAEGPGTSWLGRVWRSIRRQDKAG